MGKFKNISDSVAGQAGMVAGAAAVAAGVVQIIHSQRHAGTRVVGRDGTRDAVPVCPLARRHGPSFIALVRHGRTGAAQKAALAAAGGTVLLGLTCVSSVLNGRDLGIFPVLAGITNLAWLLGSVIIAVSLKRAGKVPLAMAIGLPLTWLFSIPLSTLDGNLLAGGYLLAVGHLLANEAIERPLTQAFAARQV